MDILDFYYLGVDILIFISSLRRVIILSYELFYPYIEDYLRCKRLKKVIKYYDD